MKNDFYKTAKLVFISLLVAASACSCASKTVRFATSTVVPAAEGKVKVKKDDNDNYSIELRIKHLAPAENLTPPKRCYVAWIETREHRTQNIGQVNSTEGLFSKARKASLSAVSTFKPTQVYLTAEEDADIETPGPTVIITTRKFKLK